MWNSIEAASGWIWTTLTWLWSSFTYSLKAISRGSCASIKRASSGTRCCSASNLPSLSRLVAMKMNGPGMEPPLVWVLRLTGPGSMVRLLSMTARTVTVWCAPGHRGSAPRTVTSQGTAILRGWCGIRATAWNYAAWADCAWSGCPVPGGPRGQGSVAEMFERFTDLARRVVVLAQEEARMLNHNYIGTEHILLGLIHEGEGVAARAL